MSSSRLAFNSNQAEECTCWPMGFAEAE